MKPYYALFFVLLSIWACSNKTMSSKSDNTKTSKSKDMVLKEGQFKTGGEIAFEAANDRYEAEGKFNEWHFSKVQMKKKNIESLTATISVDLSSIWEKNADLTAHLKAPDFFYVDKFTTATIDISNVKKTEGENYSADMELNMKGLSQDMKSDFVVTSWDPLHVKGTAKVNRTLFGLGGADLGTGDLISVSYDTDVPQ